MHAAFSEGEISHWGGNKTYYFMDGDRVEYLQVGDDVARRLESARAVIARRPGSGLAYTVLSSTAAKRLGEVAPELVVVFHG